MADLSKSDRETISRAVEEALAERGPSATPAAAAAVPAALPIGNPKQFFCQNWPTAKRILEFLLPFLPDSLKDVVRKVIAVGDRIFTILC